ncbi:MAG TPA: M20/M25/M40 family metallo-hydrolase [Gaiellaceae bacterium]|nr:M20/M25/M40 family metallo-hydrolase [Gaiellaceae bacterium]
MADAQPYIDELAPFLAIPSVSADATHAADVARAGEWVCDFVRRAGGECELVDWHGQPLAIGEIRASQDAGSAPTVLCYGHFDVQPAPPLDLWQSEPFAPAVRDGWLYARGIADDKGQLYMLLRAAADLAAEGALPVNVRFCCDGEEETGGHSIVDFLEADERGADVCVIFDSGYQERGKPAFNLATRGLVYFHLKLRSGERDLHSGMYGGAALNAVHALMAALAPALARDGRLPEPLRQGIAPVTDEERAGWATLRPGAEELGEAGARGMDAAAAEEFYLRTWSEPTCEVNGIVGGEPVLQKTVLPVEAEANVSLRLAPGQDPDTIATAFERIVREAVPDGAELELVRLSDSRPGLVAPDSPAIRLGLDSFERAIGTRPLLVRSGGTLPIVPALEDKGIPTVVTGFSLPDSNVHSPNERIPVEHLPLGIAAARELFLAFREL